MISDVKESLDEIGGHIRDEKVMLMQDIKLHKAKLSEVLGYGDEVRGFDNLVWDDQVEQLDIYAEFLGPQEYHRVKNNYEKALQTMEMLYQAEIQSLNFQEQPVSATAQVQVELLSTEEIQQKFTTTQIRRFLAVFDQY